MKSLLSSVGEAIGNLKFPLAISALIMFTFGTLQIPEVNAFGGRMVNRMQGRSGQQSMPQAPNGQQWQCDSNGCRLVSTPSFPVQESTYSVSPASPYDELRYSIDNFGNAGTVGSTQQFPVESQQVQKVTKQATKQDAKGSGAWAITQSDGQIKKVWATNPIVSVAPDLSTLISTAAYAAPGTIAGVCNCKNCPNGVCSVPGACGMKECIINGVRCFCLNGICYVQGEKGTAYVLSPETVQMQQVLCGTGGCNSGACNSGGCSSGNCGAGGCNSGSYRSMNYGTMHSGGWFDGSRVGRGRLFQGARDRRSARQDVRQSGGGIFGGFFRGGCAGCGG